MRFSPLFSSSPRKKPLRNRVSKKNLLLVEALEVREVLTAFTPGDLVILQAGTGATTGQTTGAFGGGSRPDWVGNACYDNGMGRSRNDKITEWLNPAGFATNPNFTFGNAPRTLPCRSDGIKNTDFSAIKWEKSRFGSISADSDSRMYMESVCD